MADKSELILDGIAELSKGVNSGYAPLLLPRNQLSFAINSTVRGAYITHRPAFHLAAFDFGGNALLQTRFEQGLWQGGQYFKSEYGEEGWVVSIGGRIFFVVIGVGGPPYEVRDVTPPTPGAQDDPNNSGLAIAWLWQSERWMIINDGESLPIFFDGQVSRRSFGPSVVLNTVAVAFVTPDVGDSLDITLNAPYAGLYNTAVYIDDAFWQVNSSSVGYEITVTNLSEPPGVVASGTPVILPANLIGLLSQNDQATGTTVVLHFGQPIVAHTGTIAAHAPGAGNGYQTINATSVNQPGGTINANGTPNNGLFSIRSAIYQGFFASAGSAGNTSGPFVIPAVGASSVMTVSAPYNGPLPQRVVVNGGVYEITAANNIPVPSSVINVTNINETPTAVIPIGAIVRTIPELPVGKMGAYGKGRNWMALPDARSFIASDIVGSSSGTPALNNRDSVLRITENGYLAGGGTFVVPGNVGDIRAMVFVATLDTSLGQGALQIFTTTIVFSCMTPVERADWQNVTNPILTESLRGQGGQGQNSTIPVNSDTLFRSFIAINSLILARRGFENSWGNTPISREVTRIIARDTKELLLYGSAAEFSNRMLMTARPTSGGQGVFHPGTVALNFDPLSSMSDKSTAVYDGLWTGLNVLQWLKGRFNNTERAFAFTYSTVRQRIELYEVLEDGSSNFDFDGVALRRITWQFETACLFKDIKGKGPFDFIKLIDGQFRIADVAGTLNYEIFYRSQFSKCWTFWHAGSVCAHKDELVVNEQAQNITPIGIGRPAQDICDPINNRPTVISETFQFKFVFTGSAKFYGALFKAAHQPQTEFEKPRCEPICLDAGNDPSDCQPCKTLSCPPDDDYTYLLQDLPFVEPDNRFSNSLVYFVHECPDGETLTFTGTLPGWITFDEANNRFIGSAGTFVGTTQEAADLAAQQAIDAFGAAALLSGDLSCEGEPNSLIIEDYVDGTVANTEGGVAAGEPVFDGKFVYLAANGTTWKAVPNGDPLQMDGELMCNVYVYKGGPGGTYLLEFWALGSVLLWSGNNGSTTSPLGVYTNDLTGVDATPVTLTILADPDPSTPTSAGLTCVPA